GRLHFSRGSSSHTVSVGQPQGLDRVNEATGDCHVFSVGDGEPEMTRRPNHTRDCVKTQIWSFWKVKKWFKSPSTKIKMHCNENVSVDFFALLVRGEFSRSRALPRTEASRSSLPKPLNRMNMAG